MPGGGVFYTKHSIMFMSYLIKRILPVLAACFLSLAATDKTAFTPAALQFRLVVDNPTADSEPMTLVETPQHSMPPEVLNVQKDVLLDQTDVKSAAAARDRLGNPMIGIQFTSDGAKRFAAVTRENVGKRVAIVIGGKLYSAPRIMSEITGGKAEIAGAFTEQEARDLAARISGLPVRQIGFTSGETPSGATIIFYSIGMLFLVAFGAVTWILMRRKGAPRA